MKYEELARRTVRSGCSAHVIDEACAALDEDSDAFLDALDDALLSVGDAVAFGSSETRRSGSWVNWGGNQVVEPADMHRIESLSTEQIQAIVRRATNEGDTVKVLGAGHSFSDIVQTDGVLLYHGGRPHTGDILQPIDVDVLRHTPETWYIQIAANATLAEINQRLKAQKLAFRNLGSATYQTLAGAIATATHGSGLALGAVSDEVASVLFIDASGQLCRLEPNGGMTDPVKHAAKYPNTSLLQDDSLFYSFGVSMGCMGIAVQYTMRVVRSYKLRERRRRASWRQLRADFRAGKFPVSAGGDDASPARHFEVLINPFVKVDGDYDCVVMTREEVSVDARNSHPGGRGGRWLASRIVFQRLIRRRIRRKPHRVPKLVARSLNNMVKMGDFVDWSDEVFDYGHVNDIKTLSQELAFDMDDGEYLNAIDAILRKVAKHREDGAWHSGPIALRFVAPSPMFLSMMHGRRTCMVEMPLIEGTRRWQQMFRSYERIANEFDGRPHWGQYHVLTGVPGWVDSRYEEVDSWRAALRRFDPQGRFSNSFVERMGFHDPAPTDATIDALVALGLAQLLDPVGETLPTESVEDLDEVRVDRLTREYQPMIRALVEAMIPDPVISHDEVTERSIELLSRLEGPLLTNLERAITDGGKLLSILAGAVRPFHKLRLKRRRRALKRCFERGKGESRRDVAQAVKLLTLFPYYSDPRVMSSIGYKPFPERERYTQISLERRKPLVHDLPSEET